MFSQFSSLVVGYPYILSSQGSCVIVINKRNIYEKDLKEFRFVQICEFPKLQVRLNEYRAAALKEAAAEHLTIVKKLLHFLLDKKPLTRKSCCIFLEATTRGRRLGIVQKSCTILRTLKVILETRYTYSSTHLAIKE